MALLQHNMGLASDEDLKRIKLTYLHSKAQKRKQELKDAIEDNNQDGPFQDIGDHGFQVEHKSGILCNFPVTITKFWGEVPKPTTLSSKITKASPSITKKKKSSKSLKGKIKASITDKITSIKSTKEKENDSTSIEQTDEESTQKPPTGDTTKESDKVDTANSETESEVDQKPSFGNCSHPPEITGIADKKTVLIPEEHYLILEPQWEWNKEHLRFTVIKKKNTKGFKSASPPDNYVVPDYYKKIPKTVLENDHYKQIYFNKYKKEFPNLKIKDINVEFFVLKCNEVIEDQSDYNEHCEQVHGVIPTDLKKEEELAVDATIPFTLDDAQNIEDLGTEEDWAILGEWADKAIHSQVITKTTNRRTSDIISSRSRELVDRIKEVTPKTFSCSFEIQLKNQIGGDIHYSFTGKWYQVENTFFLALGNDQVVSRLSHFLNNHAKNFGGKTMEQNIMDADETVDKCFGQENKNYQQRLSKKYEQVFKIAEKIPADFRNMKNTILLTSGQALANITEAKPIITYMEQLTTIFTDEGNLKDYKEGCIPNNIPKERPIETNAANVISNLWIKTKVSHREENAFLAKLKTLANEIAQNPVSHDKEIYSYQAIKTLCKQEKVKICKGCGGINCVIYSQLKKKFLGKCNGEAAKFGNLKNFANEFNPKMKHSKTKTAKEDATCVTTTNKKQSTKSEELKKKFQSI